MGVPDGEPLRPGVAAGPVQGEENPGPDHPGEVQQLPLFRPQGAGHRPAAAVCTVSVATMEIVDSMAHRELGERRGQAPGHGV